MVLQQHKRHKLESTCDMYDVMFINESSGNWVVVMQNVYILPRKI